MSLSEDLAALRAALPAPPDDPTREQALREAFRKAIARRRRSRARGLAAAAAVAAAAVALGPAARHEGQSERLDEHARAADSRAPAPAAAYSSAGGAQAAERSAVVFYALPFAPEFSPRGSYTVVRVEVPAASFDPAFVRDPSARIEAELLVGDDGIARAIGFESPFGSYPLNSARVERRP